MLQGTRRGEGEAMIEPRDGNETIRTTTNSRTTRVFYEDPLLPYSLQCIHPRLRDAVEVKGRAELLRGAQLLIEHGTPEEVARHISLKVRERESMVEQFSSPEEEDNLCAGIPLQPAFTSPNSEHNSFYEADEELQHRCHYFLSTFTDEHESYNVPYDVQRRVVPLLYAWIVDWDFLRRNTDCWVCVTQCFCRVVQSRRRRFSVRPDFSLPWRPLVEILISLFFQSDGVMDLNVFQGMRKAAGRHLERFCELAALHFGADAWPGLWETFAPYFSADREEAPIMLCLLSHLFPIHHLSDDATGEPLPITERIVKFLLEDSLYWQQLSQNWLVYSLKILFKMSLHHVGVVDFDRYAEPLFSMVLYELHLPIAEDMAVPKGPVGFGVLSKVSLFRIGENEMSAAEGFIGNMLPRRTDSPLWNHLQRFIHATSVFLRPNATDKVVLRRVFAFYSSLVAVIHRRIKKQRSYQFMRATKKTKFEGRIIREAYLWDRDTIDWFVELVAPVLRLLLHHRLEDAPRIVGLLASLSPQIVQRLFLPYVDAGLRGHLGSPAQRSLALRLLAKCLFPLSECPATREECWLFLAEVLPLLLQWVNPGELSLSTLVMNLIFITCSMTKLRDLLGGQVAECSFALTLVERIFDCSAHVKFGKGCAFDLLMHVMNALSLNLSDETFSCCMSRVLKESEVQGGISKAHAVSCLLEPFARRAPERMMRWAIQTFAPPLENVSTPLNELQWCAHLLAGCIRGAGLAGFPYRHELLRCIHCQVSFITREEQILAAAALYNALFTAFTEFICTEAKAEPFSISKIDDMAFCDADELVYDKKQDEFEVSMCFCRSSAVQLTWREASEFHIAYVVDVYKRFVEDSVDIIRNIEQVLPPAEGERSEGLRSLLHIPFDKSANTKSDDGVGKLGDAASATASVEADVDAFTPKNVLRGVLLWLRLVIEINQEFHADVSCAAQTFNMVPWWAQDPKSTLQLLPQSLGSPLLSAVPEKIHNVLIEYAFRRVSGMTATESITAKAFYPDRSLVMQGRPRLHSTQADEMDPRGLHLVLTILAELCNITPMTPLQYDHCYIYSQGPDVFAHNVVETPKGRLYLPAMYWRMKAESFTQKRRSLLTRVVSPKRLSELLRIAHTLLFSPYQLIQDNCSHILTGCVPMMSRKATSQFLSEHLSVLEEISNLWSQENDVTEQHSHDHDPGNTTSPSFRGDDDCETDYPADGPDGVKATTLKGSGRRRKNDDCKKKIAVDDESGYGDGDAPAPAPAADAAVVVCSCCGDDGDGDDDNDEDMKGAMPHFSSQLRRIISSALSLMSAGFNSSYFYYDDGLIYRTCELLVQFPDQLVVRRIISRVLTQSSYDLGCLSAIEGARAVRLCDKLLLLAMKFAHTAPDRTLGCLLKIVALYRPSQIALLSPQSVPLLFRLAVNCHAKVRETSFHILQTLVLSLREPHPKAYVLTRRGPLEASENAAFFSSRYELLKRECPSFYGLRDVGLAFLPKAIRVDAEHVSPDMFHDGEVATVPAETVKLCKNYTEEKRDYFIDAAQGEAKQQEKRLAQEELKRIIGCLSGILDDELNPSTAGEANMDDTAQAKLRDGWIWKVMQLRHDQKTFSESRMRVWKSMGKLVGVEPSVRFFTRLVRLWVNDFVELARSGSATAKESQQSLFSCLFDVLVAAIRISKRHPVAREEALRCYMDALRLVCTSALVPHEVLDSFLRSISALHDTLKGNEVWLIYEFLFAELKPFLRAPLATDASTVKNETESGMTCCTSWCSGRTQEIVRVLNVMVHLICVFAQEVNVELLPQLCKQVLQNKELFLCSTSSSIQGCSAFMISEIMRLSLYQSEYIASNSAVLNEILSFVDCIEQLVELPPPPAPEPQPTLAPWSETPALGAVRAPCLSTADSMAVGSSPELPMEPCPPLIEGFSLDGGRCTKPFGNLATVKTFVMCWCRPLPPLLNARVKSVLNVLVRALDIALPEMDALNIRVEAALQRIAYVRLPRNTIHDMLQMLCGVLKEEQPYGKSRPAKVAVSRMLSRILLTNLHRIGKFATMQNVASAALASIGHGDGRVRSEGRLLLAVLTRVASVEQIERIIRDCFMELRGLSSVAASMTGGHLQSPHTLHENMRKRRRIALLLALCSILCATPGVVPPYVPRLMERLAAHAHDPAPEVQRAVKRTFEEWWRSHREGWELEHKPRFVAANIQIDAMLPLLTAPAYLV
ncbi:hypothetical protein C3747_15g227 [Trypanosoma cruzi]|uniref:Proteasome activator complex subunit 4 C-terminal domain-containing protein n=2 Tax=Trypanosoma cruzi TaxID=5693 RepID=A0A2V2XB69_TRYCR|nr:hypothetical protein C3747_15g227 [Trypanosoma cruzi]